ncbi:asparagine synthase (glutamine-hydrolyzing) [Ferruginibacter yonginensis]|uniref:asparagine synthase (glutamine-hydrolyzing) n=1 Tax=Ferruginibacter yonginensis TaxID=1310416 RepID=A0ABV8QPD1_9BACT
MCRIAGIYNNSWTNEQLQASVQQMCDVLQHGGPDDGGIYNATNAALVLGNRRLALLDLTSAGHQPMHYQQRYTITYNGELYNFTTLKNELIGLGHTFSNHTDTEVILAAFAQWHTAAFAKFNGMFAFALWDAVTQELFLVRDKMGIKPLYYALENEALYFASEVRAFASLSFLQAPFTNAPIYQMAYGFIPEPFTTKAAVKMLPKGCYLKMAIASGTHSIQNYYFLPFGNGLTQSAIAEQEIKNSVTNAVARQQIADAPLGVFLSGGIDSSILALLAANNRTQPLHTLSIYFDDAQYSEQPFQQLIADTIKSEHHPILLKEADFHAYFETVLHAMDMPSCDGINTWFISKFAKEQGLKAVLSGIGADELFGGYPSFHRIQKAMHLQSLPAGVLKNVGKFAGQKYNRIGYLKIKDIRGLYLFLRGHFAPDEIAAHLGAYEADVWKVLEQYSVMPQLENMDSKNVASWLELTIYMKNQLLRDADVMSMANSIEIRVPFLDDAVVNTALQIEASVKYAGTKPKQILINSFNDILPTAIWDRPKMGFSFPFQQWLQNSPFIKELAHHHNNATKNAYNAFKSGSLHWSKVLSLLHIKKHFS